MATPAVATKTLGLAKRLGAEPPAIGRFRGEVVFLAFAVVAQWIAVGLLAIAATHNGWLYYQGGDQTFFYTISWALSHGHLPETGIGYSWSLVEAPITAVAGPSFLVGLPAIVLVQVVLLLPLALVALYGTAKRLLGAGVARLAVAVWILVPFSVIPLFVQRYHGRWIDQTLPQVLGLTGMGDFASMVLLLCAAYLLFRHLDDGDWETAVLAGLVVGFVLGLKPSNALFLAAPFVGLLIGRRYRGAVVFGLALLPTVMTLVLWKQRGLGQLPLFSSATGVTLAAGSQVVSHHVAALNTHKYLKFDWAHLQNNLNGIREYFWSNRLVEWIPLAGLLGALRVSRAKGAFLGVWLGLFFLIKGSSPLASVDTASFWRLLTPAWPAYFLLGISVLAIVPTLGGRLQPAVVTAAPGRSLRRETWVAIAVLAVLPLVVVAAVPKRGSYQAVRNNARNLYVPVDRSFRVTAHAAAGTVALTWPDPGSGSVTPTYLVLRVKDGTTTDQGVNCTTRPGGVPPCVIAMDELGYTTLRHFVDRPGSGTWVYRVALAASYNADPNAGDPLLYSAPVTVRVE
jgi:hypothetical protein